MSGNQIDAALAGYAAAVARAIEPVSTAKDIDYMHVYVSEVRFGIEGEDAEFSLVPDSDSADTYNILIKGDA